MIFASSNHAVGFTPRSDFPVPDYAFPKPDTYYGVSKAAVEALAAMYHERYGMDAICLRILSCFPKPLNVRMLSTWLSPDDAGRLFEACLTAERPGFRVAFGVSANTRGGWVSLAEAGALGYQPKDDAEAYAAEIIAEHGEPDPDDPVLRCLGGEFTLPDDQIPRPLALAWPPALYVCFPRACCDCWGYLPGGGKIVDRYPPFCAGYCPRSCLPSLVVALGVVVEAVQADRDADDQRVVLARRHVHAVGVPDPEPGPGDLRDDLVPVPDLEVLVDRCFRPPPAPRGRGCR